MQKGEKMKKVMNTELKVLYLNVSNTWSKGDELVSQLQIGIVGITEWWLKEDYSWELHVQ